MFSVAKSLSRRLPTRRLLSTTTARDPVLYMWGTNSSGTLLGTEEKMWDVPTEVEWRDILGGKSKVLYLLARTQSTSMLIIIFHQVGMDVKLQEVVCGPTDTALVLSDGRCFTSGTNKFGQLG